MRADIEESWFYANGNFYKSFIPNDLYIYIQTQHTHHHHENIHSGRKIFSSPNDKSRLLLVHSGVCVWVECRFAPSLFICSYYTRPSLFLSTLHHIAIHGISVSVFCTTILVSPANNTMQWVIWQMDQQWKRVIVSSQCRRKRKPSRLGRQVNETGGR